MSEARQRFTRRPLHNAEKRMFEGLRAEISFARFACAQIKAGPLDGFKAEYNPATGDLVILAAGRKITMDTQPTQRQEYRRRNFVKVAE